MSKQSDWVNVDVTGTQALEIPKLGCLVRHGAGFGASMVFVPEAAIENGELVISPVSHTRITFSSDAQTSNTGWVGTAGENLAAELRSLGGGFKNVGKAGENLTAKLKNLSKVDKVNAFITKTWKITPTTKQLHALRELLG
jgi:hypothetical protein